MAVWATRPEKQKEVHDYFSSINSMSLRIMEDIQKVRENYGSSWENYTVKEQEQKINESMVPQDVWRNYPLPEGNGIDTELYPTLKLDTGQKVVEVHATDQNDFALMWKDEHSFPFSVESRSQMDLRLPSADGKQVKKKKKSSLEKEKLAQNGNGEFLNSLNGGFFKLKSTKEKKASIGSAFEYFGLSSSADNASTDSKSGITGKSDSEKEIYNGGANFNTGIPDINFDFKSDFLTSFDEAEDVTLDGANVVSKPPMEDLPDISFDADFLKNYEPAKKIDDREKPDICFDADFLKNYEPVKKIDESEQYKIPNSEILPSSGLSKAYDESEFMDLYPQPKIEPPPPEIFRKGNELKMKPNKSEKPKKKKSGKEKSIPVQDNIPTVLPVVSTRPKKSHRKKSSSGSAQVNPRSSLTLDGAIYNLEIAVEMNKQGMSPQIKHEKVFADENDLLKKIQNDTDLETWLAVSPGQGSPLLTSTQEPTETKDKTDAQRTGFDFLDDW